MTCKSWRRQRLLSPDGEGRGGLPAMAGMSARKRLTKPLLFGSILCALATAFVFRHSFFPEIEDLRVREYQRYEEKRQEVLQRRQQQLAELPQKRSAS